MAASISILWSFAWVVNFSWSSAFQVKNCAGREKAAIPPIPASRARHGGR
jgi:hypothetical protein